MKPLIPMLMLTLSMTAVTAVIELNPSQDNTLYETDIGNTSNGAGDRLFIGRTGVLGEEKRRRALLQFDLSGIHPDATINTVTLQLRVTNANSSIGGTAALHLLLNDWGEAGSNGSGNGAAAQNGDATWFYRFYNTLDWTLPGGDFVTPASATAPFGTSNTEFITFDSNLDLIADVQMWVDDPATNFGWLVMGDEVNAQNARGLASREFGIESVRPTLTIDYSVPDDIFFSGFEPLDQ